MEEWGGEVVASGEIGCRVGVVVISFWEYEEKREGVAVACVLCDCACSLCASVLCAAGAHEQVVMLPLVPLPNRLLHAPQCVL
jgi:hypothetical protein